MFKPIELWLSDKLSRDKWSSDKLSRDFLQVRNSSFAAYIELFTTNMYIMVVMSDPQVSRGCFF